MNLVVQSLPINTITLCAKVTKDRGPLTDFRWVRKVDGRLKVLVENMLLKDLPQRNCINYSTARDRQESQMLNSLEMMIHGNSEETETIGSAEAHWHTRSCSTQECINGAVLESHFVLLVIPPSRHSISSMQRRPRVPLLTCVGKKRVSYPLCQRAENKTLIHTNEHETIYCYGS